MSKACTCWEDTRIPIIHADKSPICEVIELVKKVAPTDSTVLITAETGTGKELVAKAIHALSGRDGRFEAVNCAAIPEDLIESELFGHRKGAFTGATMDRTGKFQCAHGGTLFLDEVGDMSLNTQAKVLRVLEQRCFEPLGTNKSVEVDVRVIAATNKNLAEEIERGNFRKDLFYRLNVIRFDLPPLRQRTDDIPLLADHFLKKYAKEMNKPVSNLSQAALDLLLSYEWPGNVRELENSMQRALVLTQDAQITANQLPPELLHHRKAPSQTGHQPPQGVDWLPAQLQSLWRNGECREQLEVWIVDDYHGNRACYQQFAARSSGWLAKVLSDPMGSASPQVAVRVRIAAPSDLPRNPDELRRKLCCAVMVISDLDFSEDQTTWGNGAHLLAYISEFVPQLRSQLLFVSRYADRECATQYYTLARQALAYDFNLSGRVEDVLRRLPMHVIQAPEPLPLPAPEDSWWHYFCEQIGQLLDQNRRRYLDCSRASAPAELPGVPSAPSASRPRALPGANAPTTQDLARQVVDRVAEGNGRAIATAFRGVYNDLRQQGLLQNMISVLAERAWRDQLREDFRQAFENKFPRTLTRDAIDQAFRRAMALWDRGYPQRRSTGKRVRRSVTSAGG
jgi:transcriptional regulator with AAA-type ATPase domain